MRETSKSFILVGFIISSLYIVKCGGVPPIDPCIINPNLPGCPPTPIPPTTTTTTTLPPATPHPICNLEVPRTVDCYHMPPGSGWLYACPPVNGVSINVPWGQELTCPGVPIPMPTPTPAPSPIPNSCVMQTSPATCPEGLPGDFRDVVNTALSAATGCQIGTSCDIPNWQPVIVNVMTRLQVAGYCTSYDIDSGDCWKFNPDGTCAKKGLGSELGLRNSLAKTEYYQPVTANKKARWADNRSICRPAHDEEDINTVKTFLEVGNPVPVPTPTPIPGNCPIPAPGDNWIYDLKPHGGQLVDLTPYVGNPTRTPNVPWPGCGVNRCPLSCEKGPIACACGTALFGNPIWSTFAGECSVFPPDPNSLMTVKVASGSCRLTVKGSAGAPIVGSWPVFAGSPPCTVGSNGLCSQ